MIELFPNLVDSQVVLARAMYNTGIVIDEEYNFATTNAQRVFTIYPNKEDALQAALTIVQSRPDIECWIQSRNDEIVHYIHMANVKDFI
ncbi:hypothetical protein GCM10023149_44180 [Mucilaginibacter gynuensis]|uniref:DUF2007 domain-containing protein n=1 Tax=Mucilaginibacter gynuensis TaxID=1302236 RepID=A0ABP8H967_9SPHI